MTTTLLALTTRSESLQENSSEWFELKTKVGQWGQQLKSLRHRTESVESWQALRSQQAHHLPRHLRYREQQSIESHLKSARQLQPLLFQAIALLRDIVAQAYTAPDNEALFKAIDQLASLHEQNQQLATLKDTVILAKDAQVSAMLETVITAPRPHVPGTHHSASPVSSPQSVLLVLMVVIHLAARLINRK